MFRYRLLPTILLLATPAICHDPAVAAFPQQSPPAQLAAEPADPALPADPTAALQVLKARCWSCHNAEKRESGLRLDQRAHLLEGGDSGPAAVPGNSRSSRLLARITSTSPDERMPPPDAGDALKPAEVATLRAWLAAGAPWSEHWAFVAPVRPVPPTVREATWPKNDVDRFVLARLEQEGLRPSAEATRTAWLRRVTFDLLGLPPTPAELDAFVADQAADAYEKVVDRLLADPRYGERMASDWLDLARYADSSGYQRDTPRQAWKASSRACTTDGAAGSGTARCVRWKACMAGSARNAAVRASL